MFTYAGLGEAAAMKSEGKQIWGSVRKTANHRGTENAIINLLLLQLMT